MNKERRRTFTFPGIGGRSDGLVLSKRLAMPIVGEGHGKLGVKIRDPFLSCPTFLGRQISTARGSRQRVDVASKIVVKMEECVRPCRLSSVLYSVITF